MTQTYDPPATWTRPLKAACKAVGRDQQSTIAAKHKAERLFLGMTVDAPLSAANAAILQTVRDGARGPAKTLLEVAWSAPTKRRKVTT